MVRSEAARAPSSIGRRRLVDANRYRRAANKGLFVCVSATHTMLLYIIHCDPVSPINNIGDLHIF